MTVVTVGKKQVEVCLISSKKMKTVLQGMENMDKDGQMDLDNVKMNKKH